MLRPPDLTRERLDELAALAGVVPPSDAQLTAGRHAALAGRPPGDLWVFAYGSLIWNPAIAVLDKRSGCLDGWQRSFCLDLPGGRGTPERPGLTCGLVPGGRCSGLALRIAADAVESETALLWLREMAFGAYRAALRPVVIDGVAVESLTFLAEPSRVVHLPLEEQARRIAGASGPLGTNREYLFRLDHALAEHGLADPYVTALAARTRSVIAAAAGNAEAGGGDHLRQLVRLPEVGRPSHRGAVVGLGPSRCVTGTARRTGTDDASPIG